MIQCSEEFYNFTTIIFCIKDLWKISDSFQTEFAWIFRTLYKWESLRSWASLVNINISQGYNCPMQTKKKRCALFSSVYVGYFILFASLCYANKTCTWMSWLRVRFLDHHVLTMAPFISLNTTPLKIIGEFGSDRSSGSKRQPSCLDQNSSIITQLFIMILQLHVHVGDQGVLNSRIQSGTFCWFKGIRSLERESNLPRG